VSFILYGGLFDPVHLGHIEIARRAYEQVKPEKVIWIPSACPPHRKVGGISALKRKNMLEWLFDNIDEYEVSSVELSEGHQGYSAETLKIFQKKYPRAKIYMLIGSDEGVNFKKWKSWEYILENATLIIGKRGDLNGKLPKEVKASAVMLNNRAIDVSSTMLRQSLKKGEPAGGYLPERLGEYIKKQGLYL
jgi:nicotinate-nucleotide adenylyltransferase